MENSAAPQKGARQREAMDCARRFCEEANRGEKLWPDNFEGVPSWSVDREQ